MQDALVAIAAEIVSAYVANNSVSITKLSGLIAAVHRALQDIQTSSPTPPADPARPAVPIKKSVTNDYIICLEDGLKFKALKRHLWKSYKMTPEEYRKKWALPGDYPMTAKNYAAERSRVAKAIGLGVKSNKRAEPRRYPSG